MAQGYTLTAGDKVTSLKFFYKRLVICRHIGLLAVARVCCLAQNLLAWFFHFKEGGICKGLLQAVKSLGVGYFQSSHLFQTITEVVLDTQ